MTYFSTVQNLDDLKAQYRTLAMKNHPDQGGDVEIMKAINNEYDQLFPIWKAREQLQTNETADSFRSEFYTANGWKGENYRIERSTKEIAEIIRTYCKEIYSAFKFSVTFHSYSGGSSISLAMMEAPREMLKKPANHVQLNQYSIDRDEALTDEARTVFVDVVRLIDFYIMDDSDSMIDYFSANFYYSLNIGKWDKPFKIVPREPKKPDNRKYETVVVKETKTRKETQAQPIPAPTEFKEGQHFRLKCSFSGGAHKGCIFQITDLNRMGGEYINSYKMDRKLKKVCTGDVRGNRFYTSRAKFFEWVEQDAIEFVELREIAVKYEVEKTVKRFVKPETKIPGASKPVKAPQPTRKPDTDGASRAGCTIIPDTRNGSRIWVVQLPDGMDADTLKTIMAAIASMGAYYSKPKRGFVFRHDPAHALENLFKMAGCDAGQEANGQPKKAPAAEPKAPDNSADVAEMIEDTSTKIILDLRLPPGEYIVDSNYRQRMEEYLQILEDRLTSKVVEKISYKGLQEIVSSILEKIKQKEAAA